MGEGDLTKGIHQDLGGLTPETPRNKPWGNVTNATEHIPQHFRYLVHALNPHSRSTMMLASTHAAMSDETNIDHNDGNQSINLFNQPERVAERVSLSCSLIDEDHTSTWDNVGLIIEAPSGNICITRPEDAGAVTMSKRLLLQNAAQEPPIDPDQLLARTHPDSYNEVSALATHNGEPVRLAGFFYKTLSDGITPVHKRLTEAVKAKAEELHLPVVPIPARPRDFENKVITIQGALLAVLNGNYYTLRGASEKFLFSKSDERTQADIGMRRLTMSPDEMEEVLTFLSQQGFEPSDIHRLRQEYLQYDERRQRPKVKFKDNGEIASIERYKGYGYDEERVYISGTYSEGGNAIDEQEKADVRLLKNDSHFDFISSRRERPPLKPEQIDEIVAEAIQFVQGDDKEKIMHWYEIVKPAFVNVWEQYQRDEASDNKIRESFLKIIHYIKQPEENT